MKRLIVAVLLIAVAASAALAQRGNAEGEIRKLIAEYDQAGVKHDIAFFERMLADDYVYAGTNGKSRTRAEVLAEMRKEAAQPTYKMTATASQDVRVRVTGDVAVVTANWTSTTVGPDSNPYPPHNDSGRYTTVFEKRNGRWLIVADHVTEKPHAPEEQEPDLQKASQSYDAAVKAGDAAALARLLADDYMYTNEDGRMRTKAEEIAALTSPDVKIESASTGDKKFRIYRNTAVETGSFAVKGTNKGKPFTENGRYTAMWVWRDGRWQVVADHTSVISQSAAASK